MLIISRKRDQKIVLADNIEVTILEVGRNRVRFGIKAPKEVPIHTKLKDSPIPEQEMQVFETKLQDLLNEELPATVSTSKQR